MHLRQRVHIQQEQRPVETGNVSWIGGGTCDLAGSLYMDSLLSKLADELLIQDITEPSAVLGSLSADELQTAYDFVLEQFALELLIGAHENSEWSNGKLIIDANHGPIHLLQVAFYALRLEVQRRNPWCD